MAITWYKAKETPISENAQVPVSIIVAFRNEASNLPTLIHCLENQRANLENCEIIFLDDHSEDNGATLIQTGIQHTIIQLENFHGKKAAVEMGVRSAKNDWIITLDADVMTGPDWLSGIMSGILTLKADMIILPLIIDEGKSVFEKMQCLEFMSIVGSTGAMAMGRIPILCNGANLVFSKKAWLNAAEDRHDDKITSGDDMFLLQALKKKGKICWMHHPDIIARTSPCVKISSFISQRIRWASKSFYYKDITTKIIGLIVLLVNASLVTMFSFALFNSRWWGIFLLSLLIKSFIDALLIYPAARWSGKQHLLKFHLVLSLIYPFYAVFISLAGFFIKPKWKGRRISLGTEKHIPIDK